MRWPPVPCPMTAERVLALARGELGVTESPKGSNEVKYNKDYGGGPKAWCCVFLWWLFRQAGAEELFYGGWKTAYCPTLLAYYKKQDRLVQGAPEPGDIVFFDFNGNGQPDHVGLCESWDGERITSIDGNTGQGNEANGGAVLRRTRPMSQVCAVARPAYQSRVTACPNEEEQAWFDTLMNHWLARRAEALASPWSRMAEARAAGITDGTRPGSFATREETATMILNAMKS